MESVSYHWQWFWYLAGALVTLVWKWQRYCYSMKTRPGDGEAQPSRNPPTSFWDSSLEWWKSETLGSQVSWGATIGGVWLLGTVLITKQGAEWLAGGIFLGVPVMAPMSFFVGSLAEMIIPSFAKWIVRKFGGDAQ